jgi:carbamoyltransferase
LGSALLCASETYKEKLDIKNRNIGSTGPKYTEEEYLKALQQFEKDINYKRINDITSKVANQLASNKVLGWFQGQMEFGARALGNRSILASPLPKEMKDKINVSIKNREKFRPFAASIPANKASTYFDIIQPSPYMQFVVPIKKDKVNLLNAINHFETCRIQTVSEESNPIFHQLLNDFGNISGHPVLLNTSFNGKDQPIVCSPTQAIETFLSLNLDGLCLGNYWVTVK